MDNIYQVSLLGQGPAQGAEPAANQASTGQPAAGGPAPGAAARAPGCGGPEQIIFMLGMLVLFYFLLIRPQQKKQKQHQAMVNELKRGDSVITSSGIFGRITAVEGNVITIEIAKGTNVRILKSSIGGKATDETAEKIAKDPQPGANP